MPTPHSKSSSSNTDNNSATSPTNRPSLLQGLPSSATAFTSSPTLIAIPPRPHRLWSISDTHLRTLPPHSAPLNRSTSCLVTDAPPSVIATRIAECLRQRQVAVEYDDEAAIATCTSMDHVDWNVYLWKQQKHDAVIVECVRVKGSTISFHSHCRAILLAAQSLSAGKDTRCWYQTNGQEPTRLYQKEPSRVLSTKLVQNANQEALEHALALLRKDRLDAQRLGWEQIVLLTDRKASGLESAHQVAKRILVAGNFLWSILLRGQQQSTAAANTTTSTSGRSLACGILVSPPTDQNDPTHLEFSTDNPFAGDLRALALRALTNILVCLPQLPPHASIPPDIMLVLLEDIRGATRPPTATRGTQLASPHEAILACTCVRFLSGHERYRDYDGEEMLRVLDRAIATGTSTNPLLEREATETRQAILNTKSSSR